MASWARLKPSGTHKSGSSKRGGSFLRSTARALALTLLLALPACSPTVPPNAPPQPDAGCTVDLPRRETLESTDPVETLYLAAIIVCSNETTGALSLSNNSEMVWAFTASFPANRIEADLRNAEITQFHNNFPSTYRNAYMAPGERVAVIGGSDALAWAIDPELSLAWTANSYLMAQFKAKGLAAVETAMTDGSPTHKAVWDCTVAVYDAGTEAGSLVTTAGFDPMQLIKEAWGLTGTTGTCVDSWKSASQEAGEKKIPKWSQFMDDAGTALEPAAELGSKSTKLKNAVVRTLPRICVVLRKMC